ncbi:5'-methylthioadenosine/adenosylhomocysteine nucleosidase [Petrocella sp. FN5]|nr:5'-methylthioadenosine/adenosylhomocysteine nucleosidase [Petrocella sp. FN5]MDF1618667.1 5'-methylthioadenosine/adenosylhomocysteine nucleosidase [Petrocella sp. FN5]
MEIIGIIGAMEEEVLTLKEKMDLKEVRSIASLEFYVGSMSGASVVIVKGGIGKVNSAVCTQILIDCFHVDAIINTGVAGALSDALEIGDVVISSDTIQHDMDATGFGYALGEVPRMGCIAYKADQHLIKIAKNATDVLSSATNVYVERIVSGDQFISDIKKKIWLLDKFDAYCTEMEGGAVAQASYLNKIPFVIIRSISDKADDSAEMNFNEFTQLAASNSCKIIIKMLELI